MTSRLFIDLTLDIINRTYFRIQLRMDGDVRIKTVLAKLTKCTKVRKMYVRLFFSE